MLDKSWRFELPDPIRPLSFTSEDFGLFIDLAGVYIISLSSWGIYDRASVGLRGLEIGPVMREEFLIRFPGGRHRCRDRGICQRYDPRVRQIALDVANL